MTGCVFDDPSSFSWN